MSKVLIFKTRSSLAATGKKILHRMIPDKVLRKKQFRQIYLRNGWREPETRSGHASTMQQTGTVRRELPQLIRKYNVKTLLDVACGDMNWIQHADLGVEHYIGADIVPEIVESNTRKFGSRQRTFINLDVTNDPLPNADMILCRDCLIHLNNRDIIRALKNIANSRADYLLTTTFTDKRNNRDIATGDWRPVNLQRSPFRLPAPVLLINENFIDAKNRFADKCLGLWRIKDIETSHEKRS